MYTIPRKNVVPTEIKYPKQKKIYICKHQAEPYPSFGVLSAELA